MTRLSIALVPAIAALLAVLNGCAWAPTAKIEGAGAAAAASGVSVALVEARCYLDDRKAVDLRVVFRVTNGADAPLLVHPADVQLMDEDKRILPDQASPDGTMEQGTERQWTVHFTQERGTKCYQKRVLGFSHVIDLARTELPLPPLSFWATLADD